MSNTSRVGEMLHTAMKYAKPNVETHYAAQGGQDFMNLVMQQLAGIGAAPNLIPNGVSPAVAVNETKAQVVGKDQNFGLSGNLLA